MPAPPPLTLEVRGIDPEGQARARTFEGPGGRRLTWSPKSDFYKAVARAGGWKRPKFPLDGPLGLTVTLLFPRPKSVPIHQWFKWTRPDGDNCLKAVQDALSEARWWAEDSRVVDGRVVKRYAPAGQEPGVIIRVERVPDPNWKDD